MAKRTACVGVELDTVPDRSQEAPANHPRSTRASAANLRALSKEFGTAYALMAVGRKLAGWLPAQLDDRMLAIEGRRGVLGPAHRRWDQHSVATNREVWSQWEWSNRGEEWTASPEWKQSLIDDVLVQVMPAGGTVIEIGPGAGRWTGALHARAERLILVDITDTTLELCRELLGDPPDVGYVRTDGAGLRDIATDSIDAVWSFDAFVHIAPLDVAAYLKEIGRTLRAGGVALIHHTGRRDSAGWRSPMTASLFANLAAEGGLTVERQFDRWAGGRFGVDRQGDVLTLMRHCA
jgi:ubiquinone/menaquinone biosynthesis C-methylase UbiE